MARRTKGEGAALRDRIGKLNEALEGLGGARVLGRDDLRHVNVIPSGVDTIDVATGVGGWPEGRIVVFHGAEACGKTTLALLAVAEVQRRGGVALYFDFEHKLDLPYAHSLGVDVRAMVLAHPLHIEEGFDLVEKAIGLARQADRDCPIVIVWDSLQSAGAKRTIEQGYDEGGFSPEASAYSRSLKKILGPLDRARALLIGISQVRVNIDGFGGREKVAVGKAFGHHAVLIGQMRSTRKRGSTTALEGEDGELQFTKNQVGVPFVKARFRTVYGIGFDPYHATLEALVTVGLAELNGSWYSIGGEKFQGAGGFEAAARSNPEWYAGLREAVRSNLAAAKPAFLDDLDEDEDGGAEASASPAVELARDLVKEGAAAEPVAPTRGRRKGAITKRAKS